MDFLGGGVYVSAKAAAAVCVGVEDIRGTPATTAAREEESSNLEKETVCVAVPIRLVRRNGLRVKGGYVMYWGREEDKLLDGEKRNTRKVEVFFLEKAGFPCQEGKV